MQVAHTNFGEAVKEVYELDWSCRPKMVDYFKVSLSDMKIGSVYFLYLKHTHKQITIQSY